MLSFYESLPTFKHFNGITEDLNFKPVPADWVIFIADIRGSTKAIAEGKYREVNMIGAASIVVTRNAMKKNDFPFVFGGDGATIIIPHDFSEVVKKELYSLKIHALQQFNLDLRVGMLHVKQLYDAKKTIEIGRFELTPGTCIAMLRGDGVDMAEQLIKRSGEKYEVSQTLNAHQPDLSQLSCRWQPMPSKNGRILSLIIQSRKGDFVFKEVLERMYQIFPNGLESLNPVHLENAEYKSFWQCLKEEHLYLRKHLSKSFVLRLIQIFNAVMLFKYHFPLASARIYLNSIEAHSDFRKFDNTLRMVLDCKTEQIDELENLLRMLYENGSIYFGTFQTNNSIMTCLVSGLSKGEHIHFIDAENGGYALAALALKKQIGSMPMA